MQGEVKRGNWLLTCVCSKVIRQGKETQQENPVLLVNKRRPRNLNQLKEESPAHTRQIQLEPEAQVESTVNFKGYWCVLKLLGYFVWVCFFLVGNSLPCFSQRQSIPQAHARQDLLELFHESVNAINFFWLRNRIGGRASLPQHAPLPPSSVHPVTSAHPLGQQKVDNGQRFPEA